MMISLKEIGKICGLAESTVSKALKGAPGIRRETVERVREVARRYGYQPNAMVRCIQTGRSRSVGIAYNRFQDEFGGGVIKGILEVLYENDYDACLISWDRMVRDNYDILSRFRFRRVDALLMFPAALSPQPCHLEALRKFSGPVVMIDSVWEGFRSGYVGSDSREAIFDAVRLLRERGYRKIGLFSYSAVSTGAARRELFFQAMAEAALPVDLRYCVELTDCWNEVYERAAELLRRPDRPDALFCFNDYVANDVLNAALDLGVDVPEELGLIGFGNLPFCERLRPCLASIDQFPEEIGRRAACLLLDLLDGREENASKEVLVKSRLVCRGSVRDAVMEDSAACGR